MTKIFKPPVVKTRTLEQMQNYGTSYEVIAVVDEKQIFPLEYTPRKTKSILLKIAQKYGNFLLQYVEGDPDVKYKKNAWHFGNVVVKYSGKTERDIATDIAMKRKTIYF